MKRFISILLTTCMLLSVAVMFSGCGLFKKKVDSGTEAAKLLLANERLDASSISSSLDLGVDISSNRGLGNLFRTFSERDYANLFWKNDSSSNRGANSREIIYIDNGKEYTWDSFGENYSSSMIEFSQFIESIETRAEYASEDIEAMKSKVGVIDKWVKSPFTGETQMLRVFESADVLICKDDDNNISVYYRYTDESAKNVYEMYSFMNYDDGTTGKIKTLLIPGERCEYAYRNSGGFDDYFIAENTRGYWTATRYSYIKNEEQETSSFYPYAIKDNLGFGTSAFLDKDVDRASTNGSSFSVFDPISNRDLFRVYDYSDSVSFFLNFSAIKSGLISITGIPSSYDTENEIYFGNQATKLETVNGTFYPSRSDAVGEFFFSGMDISYDYMESIYTGSINFEIRKTADMDVFKAYKDFVEYLGTLGISIHCDTDAVETSIEFAMALSNNFLDTLEWNGYTLNSLENVSGAIDVLANDYEEAYDIYESVKDYETVNARKKLSEDAKFADIEIVLAGGNTFDGYDISISSLSVACTDTALFESGLSYVLKIGLALIDENGNPISVNTVPLTGGSKESVVFEGDGITLLQGGTFNLPKNLDSGEYAVVTYIATADEGIRVSEMEKISFIDIFEGKIESSAMNIESFNKDSFLTFKYSIKNIRYIEFTMTKESYSYKEIRRMIMTEALAHGAPYSGAVLEYENGTAVDQNASLGAGVYRMMVYLKTDDGMAQSYVYLTVK